MKKSLIIMVLSVLSFSAAAQESIERVSSEYGSTSIIRQNAAKEWLVYSNPAGFCDFNRIREGNSVVDILRLPPEFKSVSDFKIHDGFAYFCGMMNDAVPCLGYFSTGSSFPNSTINIVRLPTLRQLNKLEVMSDYSATKVVMVGSTSEGGIIVDLTSQVLGWNAYFINTYISSPSNVYIYNDVAILDSFVVVTSNFSRDLEASDSPSPSITSILWYFDKPASAFTPLTMMNVKWKELPHTFRSAINIKKCEQNAFVVAGLTYGTTPIVGGYNGYNHVGTLTLSMMASQFVDFAYSPDSKTTELIVNPIGSSPVASEVYTLLPGMALVPGTIGTAYGHLFPEHRMKSIAYRPNNPLYFISVGDSIGNNNDLFMYTYFFDMPMGCSEAISVGVQPLKDENECLPASKRSSMIYYISPSTTPIIKGTGIHTICGKLKSDFEMEDE